MQKHHQSLDQLRFETLYQLSQMTGESEKAIKDFALEAAVKLTRSQAGYLFFVDEEKMILTVHAWSQAAMENCKIADIQTVYKLEETGLWGEAVRQRKPILTNDYTAPNSCIKGTPAGHLPLKRHLSMPLIDDGKIILVVGVANKEAPYDQEDILQLNLLVGGMWRIIQKKNTEEELYRQKEFAEGILNAAQAIVLVMDSELRVVSMNRYTEELLGYSQLELVGKEWLTVCVPPSSHTPLQEKWSGELMMHGSFQHTNPIFTRSGEERIIEWRNQMLVDTDGRFSGCLSVGVDVTEREKNAIALKRVNQELNRNLKAIEQYNHELLLFNELGNQLQSQHSQEDILTLLIQYGQKLFPGATGRFTLTSPESSYLIPVGSWGKNWGKEERITANTCFSLQKGDVHTVESANNTLRCPISYQIGEQQFMPSICYPLSAHGETFGTFCLFAPPGKDILEWQHTAATLAQRASLALFNQKLLEKLENQSTHDPLTELHNRRYMEDTLSNEIFRSERSGKDIGIIMLDVDYFKRYNDTYGHVVGDLVLKTIAEFLKRNVRAGDILCRYGGEEFIIILPGTTLKDSARRAEQLRQGVVMLKIYNGKQKLESLTISFGVSAYPMHGDSAAELIRAADSALYVAKRNGRNQVRMATTHPESFPTG